LCNSVLERDRSNRLISIDKDSPLIYRAAAVAKGSSASRDFCLRCSCNLVETSQQISSRYPDV